LCPACGSDWTIDVPGAPPGPILDITEDIVIVLDPEPGASLNTVVCALCGHRFAARPVDGDGAPSRPVVDGRNS
jgi:hypothetical protein